MAAALPLEAGSNRLAVLGAEILAAHDAAVEARETAVERARDAGRGLIEAKDLVAHGGWLPWLESLGINERTARVYMQLARLNEPNRQRVADLSIRAALEAIRADATQAEKRSRRDARERELAAATARAADELGSKIFNVIYADPPWRFEPYSRETGMDRAADNHYPTASVDAIKLLQVPAADDAILFLWATVPMLPEALDVMSAWGFTYRSHFVWEKDRIGTGYWTRNRHELLLIGTRGDIPAPAPGDQYESVIKAAVGEHSTKPFHFREIIEDMFPTLARVELFARGKWSGWDCWGNEGGSPP